MIYYILYINFYVLYKKIQNLKYKIEATNPNVFTFLDYERKPLQLENEPFDMQFTKRQLL